MPSDTQPCVLVLGTSAAILAVLGNELSASCMKEHFTVLSFVPKTYKALRFLSSPLDSITFLI